MEEFKNGAISEEALDEIAGGLHMPKVTLKQALIGAGVAILAATGIGATTLTAIGLKKMKKKGKNTPQSPAKSSAKTPVESPIKYEKENYKENDINSIDPYFFSDEK